MGSGIDDFGWRARGGRRAGVLKDLPRSRLRCHRQSVAVAGGISSIALRTAARSRLPAPAGSQRRLVRRHRRTRLQCAGRHPQRSISMPSAATLTRRFVSYAI